MGSAVNDTMDVDEAVDAFEEVIDNLMLCSECDSYTEHEILRERDVGTGRDILLKCQLCLHIYSAQMRKTPALKIPFILTDGPNSHRVNIEVDEDENFIIGDVFEENQMLWTINQLIDKMNLKKQSMPAKEALVISALRTDMVRVKITATRGENSESSSILVDYGTTFTGGHKMDYQGEVWRIRAIHTGSGRTMKGTVEAQNIKRIYLHEPPNQQHFEPKTPRERRKAWKEGRLGYNPNPEIPKEVTKKRVTPTNKRKRKRPRR